MCDRSTHYTEVSDPFAERTRRPLTLLAWRSSETARTDGGWMGQAGVNPNDQTAHRVKYGRLVKEDTEGENR